MVLAFAIFIVSPCAAQDMSKLETRFEQVENFGLFWGFFSSAGVTPSWRPHPPSWAAQGPEKPFAELFSAQRGHLLSPSFPAFRAERRIIRKRKKAQEPA